MKRTFPYIFLFLFLNVGFNTAQETRKIDYKANTVEYDKRIGKGAMRLLNEVTFEHEGVLMSCDSAYLYTKTNSLEAYYNVHINQGDTLHLYGDYLEYDGNIKLAKVRSNVLLQNVDTRLVTNSLDYNLDNDFAHYYENATIYSTDNELKSREGYYYAKEKAYLFQDSVVLENPEYTIYSDTLRYNTITNTAYFLSATNIISDSNTIYCERGWYNTETNISKFTQNNKLQNPEQILWSDTLYYDRNQGIGEANSNVTIYDVKQEVLLKGNYAFSNQTENTALVTDSAQFIVISETDSLYLHADTLRSLLDTNDYRTILAYYGVRIFKSDLQAICDSLSYSFADSIIRMFDYPAIWSGENQLTAENVEMLTRDGEVYRINMNLSAFIISEEDTAKYNQIKGKNMVAHLTNNQLHRIDVLGNGQTIYYVADEDDVIGMNTAESSDLIIYVVDKQIDKINFMNKPDAIMFPLSQTNSDISILDGFVWRQTERPINRNDIFRKAENTNSEVRKETGNKKGALEAPF
jgi:lipopolysaccharide export system protein LptA